MQDSRPFLTILASHLAIGMIINVVCAVVATYMMQTSEGFTINLVFSMCVGTLALLFIDGGRLVIWGRGIPPRLPFIGLVVVAMPMAKFIGNAIAIRTLGMDAESMAMYPTRSATAMLLFTVLACVIITWFFWSRSQVEVLRSAIESEKARAAAIEKQALQAQLQLLQAQIEPHMLFNTLANLQGLIAIDPTRAQHMLDQLILYLRATLSSSRAEKTTLAHEFSLMEAYLGLMSVRMGARLGYTLQLPEALAKRNVPPMLLQPLIENAIKHGLEPKIDGGHIAVEATERDGMVILEVADTGLGLDDSGLAVSSPGGTHVGLANVRERLQFMYGERAAVSLEPNSPSGAIARLTFPL